MVKLKGTEPTGISLKTIYSQYYFDKGFRLAYHLVKVDGGVFFARGLPCWFGPFLIFMRAGRGDTPVKRCNTALHPSKGVRSIHTLYMPYTHHSSRFNLDSFVKQKY